MQSNEGNATMDHIKVWHCHTQTSKKNISITHVTLANQLISYQQTIHDRFIFML